jgi:hypothetical protein
LDQAFWRDLSVSFLLFSSKLVLFSSNLFDLDANFFGIWTFLVFLERYLGPWEFSSGKSALSAILQEGFPFPRLELRNLHLFLLEMLITATTTVTLMVFVVSIVISMALIVLLGAVSAT